ncbi:MAG: hypothetical protein R2867_21650 [Caldilineaceae bacterium]
MFTPKTEVPVVFATDNYSYLGLLDTGGKRLQDILNDSLTDYLSLRKVQVATTIDGSTIVEENVPSDRGQTKHYLGAVASRCP